MIRLRRSRTAAEASQDNPKGFDAFELRLGDVMRGERATLGKSLLDVQRELKIRATYIAAIENADPTAFETPGFIAGYVRSYARYLGLDPEWAYRRFREEANFDTVHGMDAAAAAPRPAPKAVPAERRDPLADPNAIFVPRGEALISRIEPGAIGSSLVLIALMAGLGYGGWSVLREIQQVKVAPLDQQPGLMADIGPLAGEDSADPVAPSPSADAMDRLYRPQVLDRPVLVARDAPIATLDPGEIGVLLPPQRTAAAPAPVSTPLQRSETVASAPAGSSDQPVQVVAADTTPEIAILAVRPAWVRVSAPNGSVLFEKILDAGERYVLPETEEPPLLRAGNSASVYFSVGGQTYGPADASGRVAKNVELSPDAVAQRYQVADIQSDPDLAVALAQAEGTPAQ
ncbi:helix-turn-helix domain-containing protein [Rhodovulum adriaticum]|uniref:Cytoskeletal protein RodZ n=1 Tax=Rhodovulum adriaticum TaxID=35804 RepID=A0A4R2NUF1_RHOAD|nr:helix-turn-helix domain-containing protein [Rhodovulum adriaticum]MBK1636459.1 helix-turn-helix domain-containing protein [Rhodovulum adriaticum]TCP25537.1 cytoskeletal protein RodZ [Rhodovulum adriaticum]